MTETKSAMPTAAGSGTSVNKSNSGTSSSSTSTMVKKMITTTSTSVAGAVTMMTATTPKAGAKIISVVNTSAVESKSATTNEKNPPRRRPMPRLIPIVDQQQRHMPTIIRLQSPVSPPVDSMQMTTMDDEDYYNMVAGRSALSDFASLIDDHYDQDNIAAAYNSSNNSSSSNSNITTIIPTNMVDRWRSGSSTSSSTSPKNKTASFFDKLKARVDETADLTCLVCRYESKCLSEFMRHQRTHDDHDEDDDDDDEASQHIIVVNKAERTLPPPVTAAELKSTRCQRCRKRCKTSTELVVHLATCRGATSTVATAGVNHTATMKESDDRDVKEQHPMENKIFVWNTSVLPTEHGGEERDPVPVIVEAVMPTEVSGTKPPSKEQEQEDEEEEGEDNDDDEEEEEEEEDYRHEQFYPSVPKEGKTYKTVFKCPHCTFWAATASRFHVHIVGHLNRKPFECSCCAYRSNWRWDITKHIRLKSARKVGGEESATATNSHHGAKVLMTDETGRRNYSKYNRYLTVMEMAIADSANRTSGGDFDDGKGVTGKKPVVGGVTRKRRINGMNRTQSRKQTFSSLGRTAATGGVPVKKFKTGPNRNQKNAVKPPLSVAGSDNRSKTVWKCKKCFFRDCDRLTVLNHVKAHYRRGEFANSGGPSASPQNSSQYSNDDAPSSSTTTNNNNKNIETKNMIELKETTEKKTPTTERRKIKAPITGTTGDSLLLLSTNPKSLMLYDDENFLSCPLCDVTANSSGQLKEHMQRTHIPEETKYRCEYCPFWSEEKKAMLDHMMFAHEMDDGSVNTDVNAADISYGIEQRDEINSNSNDEDDEEIGRIDKTGSNDTTANMKVFDNGSGDDTTTTANMEVVFDTNEENMVVVETVECKPDFGVNDGETTAPNKSSEKNSYDNTITDDKISDIMMSCEYEGGEERENNEHMEDEEIIARAEAAESLGANNNKITKAVTTATASTEKKTRARRSKGNQVYECNECWYFSTNKKDVLAHRQLHVKRGALYNCSECVFNVTKPSILYHHYRYGHMVEEPELRYSEESVVQAGHRDMIAKNDIEALDRSGISTVDTEESGPPMVWSYNKESIPPFTKVFKCRYCPHTNRRRHNTVEHERMHSDHPEHQHHRQQQQRLSGTMAPPPPLHPCKRCTYVCNNAGVLASHAKVHSISYGNSTKGFYDGTIVDVMQVRALEYVMELEQSLLLDKSHRGDNSKRSSSDYDRSSDSTSDSDTVDQDDTKYTELDDPELKFCPYCPARFFFRSDLRCHLRFHKFRNWLHACNCCSFVARDPIQLVAHEIVHQDEYTQRTVELLASGYPVSQRYPRPLVYMASVGNNSPAQSQQHTYSPSRSPKYEAMVETSLPKLINQQERPTKRIRYSEPGVVTAAQPLLKQQEATENTSKRQRRSSTVSVTAAKPPSLALLPPPSKSAVTTTVSMMTSTATGPQETTTVAMKSVSNTKNTTKSAYIKQFTCDKCPGRFFKATALQYHYTLHGGSGRYRCRRCDYTVSTYGNLVRHESVHQDLPAREKVKLMTSKVMKSPLKSKTKITKKTKAPLPPPAQTSKTTIDDSCISSAVTNDEDNLIDPEFGPSMLGNPAFYYPTTLINGVARPKRYKCPKCPSAYERREQYAMHLTLHGARDKYTCDKCDYSVRHSANYVQHQRKHAHDAEIRKNLEQAAERAKMLAAQEEVAKASRGRKKSNANIQEQQPVDPPQVNLEPRDTIFRNEISDRQTAYELNAAYGDNRIINGSGENPSLFRCTQCPFECGFRSQMDRHTLHHQECRGGRHSTSTSSISGKRTWKYSCRFCTYRTHGEADLAEHTRLHFLRSTGAVLSTSAIAANGKNSNDLIIEPTDHVEFHGKRVVYPKRLRAENDSANNDDMDNGDVAPEVEEEPFFVFKDCGINYGSGTPGEPGIIGKISKMKRFSPDFQTPAVLIDYNENRTGGDTTDKPQQQEAAFVRFIDGGKRLEFLDNGRDGDTVKTPGKKKRIKK